MIVEERLTRLEKSCWRWRWLASVSVLLLVGVVVMGQGKACEAKITEFEILKVGRLKAKSIDAGEVQVVDPSGRIRAWLWLQGDDPRLDLFDKSGKARAALCVLNEDPRLDLFDRSGKIRAALCILKDDPQLNLLDGRGEVRAVLVSSADETITASTETFLCLFDKEGKVIFQAPR
jgi:hypothetical protein